MRRSVMGRCVLLLAVMLVTAGCGTDQVPVYPVSGRVTINGKPPVGEGWMAVLHREPAPVSGDEYPHPLPRAKVEPDGRFRFHTYGADDGAPTGTYKISFVNMADSNESDVRAKEKPSAGEETSAQLYWPIIIEVRPQPNELLPFDIKQ